MTIFWIILAIAFVATIAIICRINPAEEIDVMPACQATQHSDQMICTSCGLVWDTNDTDPPACRPIPDRVISDMVSVSEANGGGRSGMRAAYRLLQDMGAICASTES